MALSSAPFQFSVDAATVVIALPTAWESMDIKSLTMSITKPGANKIRGTGFSNGTNNIADYTYDNGTNVSSNFITSYCLYVKKYISGLWQTKIAGTVDLSNSGEMWFHFDNFDIAYNVNGIAIGDIA